MTGLWLRSGLARTDKFSGLTSGNGLVQTAAARVLQSETTALLARMSVQPSQSRQYLMDDMILSLKNAGVWTLLNRLYVFAHPTQADALLNWVSSSFNGTISGAITFTAEQGVTGDGVSALITTGALAAPITANNLAIGCWCRTNVAENKADMGGGAIEIRSRTATNVMSTRIVDASASSAADVTTSIGWALGTIDPSNNLNKVYYRNASVETASFARTTITTLPATTQSICGVTASTFSTKQIAVAVWAQNLTAQNNTDLYNAIHTYLVAIGAA